MVASPKVAPVPPPPAPPEPVVTKKAPKKKKPKVPMVIDDETLFDDEKWDSLMSPLAPGESEASRLKSIRDEAAQKAARDLKEMEAIRKEAAEGKIKNPKLTAADRFEMERIRDEAAMNAQKDINSIKSVRNQVASATNLSASIGTPSQKTRSSKRPDPLLDDPTLSPEDLREMQAMREEALRAKSAQSKPKGDSNPLANSTKKAVNSPPPQPKSSTANSSSSSKSANATPKSGKKQTGGLSADDAALMKQLREQALRGELDDLT